MSFASRSSDKLSTDRLDYLQRNGITPAPLSTNTQLTSTPAALRRLWLIKGIGRIVKDVLQGNDGQQRHPVKIS